MISIDVHEHLKDPYPFTAELVRVTTPGGRVIITVPNGDETKLATRIKNFVGMTKEKYGHVREGFDIPELKTLMGNNDIHPCAESSFSKFYQFFCTYPWPALQSCLRLPAPIFTFR